ncbi:peroxisomal biogenesis factor 11 [Holotrichia oblita]|uniref:Peroxisomal biogenesis factor 11 n=3 Tax=Holotrichia oblita TaxID=644536 RepID=A0ACB9TP85_HOLOL|nr:peroxisomal biogenesis factor 11 [Holotrichia oblita]KAI4468536.1 peroxisomal biogenesis factor 11 [Holotrichia oblita]KAI4468573.1 peroxisomal biogenesis factor 11 [Holotrichia oblita]
MEKVVKLNAQTAGRDKTARVLQYLSKVIWYKLQKDGKNGVATFQSLELQLSSFRKILRFGKCIDTIYSIIPLLKYDDPTVKVLAILGKLSNSIFLLADHILWIGKSDFYKVDANKWSRICSQYWLYSIILSLLRDLHEILKILRLHKEEIVPRGLETVPDIINCTYRAVICLQKYPRVTIDVLKNTCDVFLPLVALGYIKLSPGTVGTLGTISSIAGLIVVLKPTCKLSP